MTVGELIDFYLSVRHTGDLVGFDSLYEEDLALLKAKIQEFYGERETWLAMPEDAELPEEIAVHASDLVAKFRSWSGAKQFD